MSRFLRSILVVAIILAGVGLVLRWTLGDNFRPWVRVAQKSAATRLTELVDQYELELEKARNAVEKAREKTAALRAQRQQAAVRVKMTERELNLAQREINDAKQRLVVFEEKLSKGDSIRLVSGRVATPGELKELVASLGNRLEIAKEKVGFLRDLQERRLARQQQLEQLEKQSPLALQRLENSVDYLARKVEFYREAQRWSEEETAAEAQVAGLYGQAQRTLEDAHNKMDRKLAELDGLININVAGNLNPSDAPSVAEDNILADIRALLAKSEVAQEK